MYFFVQTNHTKKELLFLMFLKIKLRNNSSLHKLFYSLQGEVYLDHNAYLYDHNGNIQTYIQDGIKRKVLWWKGEEHDYIGKIQFRKIKGA